MNLFARQEQHVAGFDCGFFGLGPHHASAVEKNHRFFIQMPMRLSLRTRNVADELRHLPRAMPAIYQDLEESLGHFVPLGGIDFSPAVGKDRVKIGRNAICKLAGPVEMNSLIGCASELWMRNAS